MLRTNQKWARTSKRAKIRVVKRCLTLKAGGYPGLHRFGASQLIQFVLLNKIKLADKKILLQSGAAKRRAPKRRRTAKPKQRRNNRTH
jgi:hypothetical protein